MKNLLITLLVVAIAAFGVWYFLFKGKKSESVSGTRQEAMTVSQHSAGFNAAMQKMMDAYYRMTEAFVQWDIDAVNKTANELKLAMDSLKIEEMKKDTLIYPTVVNQWEQVRSEIAGLLLDADLTEKRASLNMLSNQMYDLLRVVKYDVAKVYLQECPMALNNYEMAANWLSPSDSIRNPYLGLKDPKYGRGMLVCGITKDTLNFIRPAKTN